MASHTLHDLCHDFTPGEATARILWQDDEDEGEDARLHVTVTVTMHVACSGCPRRSESIVTLSPGEVFKRDLAAGWGMVDGETFCDDCYTRHALRSLPSGVQGHVTTPSDLRYHRGKTGAGARGRVFVTGRVVAQTAQGDDLIEEYVSVDGVLRRETIARSYLERVTTPISEQEARAENPHLFTLVKDWVRKQIGQAVDMQARAERLASYVFYQHREQPTHVRATGAVVFHPDGTGVAEIFYMEKRSLRRNCVGQAYIEEHFTALPFVEAERLDRTLVEHLDKWVRRQERTRKVAS